MWQSNNGNQFESYEQAVRHYGGDVDGDTDDFDYDADDGLLIAMDAMQGEIATRKKLIYDFTRNGGRDPEYSRVQRYHIKRLERAIETVLRIKKAL